MLAPVRALLGLIVAMAAEGALAQAPAFRWEVPKAVASADIGGEQVALGVPLRLTAVRSQLDVESLFDFFLREFEKADLFVPPKTLQFSPPGGLSLTGLDVKRQVSYTVIFQPNPDKTTTVILGEAESHAAKAGRGGRRGAGVSRGQGGAHLEERERLGAHVHGDGGAARGGRVLPRTLGASGYVEREGSYSNGREELRIAAQNTHTAGELFVVVERREAPAPVPSPGPASGP